MAARSDNSKERNLNALSIPTGEGVVVDIGTGDGRFVYRSALRDPNRFFIGIDANVSPLKKISMKATRRPAKGGARNLIFLQAPVENLPEELNGTADEVHIHFPWGSLLGSLIRAETGVIRGLRGICAEGATLEIIFGLDPVRDGSEMRRLHLPEITADLVNLKLVPEYAEAGFRKLEARILDPEEWKRIESSWTKKLRPVGERRVVFLAFEAV